MLVLVAIVGHYMAYVSLFLSQADVTTFYIALKIMAKSWPIVFFSNQLLCFNDSKMTCQQIIVMVAD